MNDNAKTFVRFQLEHARLHDPALLRGAVELQSVDLRKFAPDTGQKVKRKKKIRHGAAAAWSVPKVIVRRVPEPATGEQLLPIDFVWKLVDSDGAGHSDELKRAETPDESSRGQPQITIETPNAPRGLKLFQEMTFDLDAPAARQGELVWTDGRNHIRPKQAIPADPERETGDRKSTR